MLPQATAVCQEAKLVAPCRACVATSRVTRGMHFPLCNTHRLIWARCSWTCPAVLLCLLHAGPYRRISRRSGSRCSRSASGTAGRHLASQQENSLAAVGGALARCCCTTLNSLLQCSYNAYSSNAVRCGTPCPSTTMAVARCICWNMTGEEPLLLLSRIIQLLQQQACQACSRAACVSLRSSIECSQW